MTRLAGEARRHRPVDRLVSKLDSAAFASGAEIFFASRLARSGPFFKRPRRTGTTSRRTTGRDGHGKTMNATTSHGNFRILGAALALLGVAIPASGCASDDGECKAAIANAQSPQPRNGAAVFVIADQRVAVANTEEGGLVCSFTVAGQKVSISGRGDRRGPGREDFGFAADRGSTEDLPGDNPDVPWRKQQRAGEPHVLYAVESGKIHKALEIASLEELAIGGHRLSERNRLTPRADGLHVEQDLRGPSRFRTGE